MDKVQGFAEQEKNLSLAADSDGFSFYVTAQNWEDFYQYWVAAGRPSIEDHMGLADRLAQKTGMQGFALEYIEFLYECDQVRIGVSIEQTSTIGDWYAFLSRRES